MTARAQRAHYCTQYTHRALPSCAARHFDRRQRIRRAVFRSRASDVNDVVRQYHSDPVPAETNSSSAWRAMQIGVFSCAHLSCG